jgi:hypothetical protein
MLEDSSAEERYRHLIELMSSSARSLLITIQNVDTQYRRYEILSDYVSWISEEERNRLLFLESKVIAILKTLETKPEDPNTLTWELVQISEEVLNITSRAPEYFASPYDAPVQVDPVLPFLLGGITACILILVMGNPIPAYVAALLTLLCSLLFWAASQLAADRAVAGIRRQFLADLRWNGARSPSQAKKSHAT